jgi:hypothetical protein
MSLVLTYPGGKLLNLAVAATAGNVATNKSPGAGKRWVILYGRITIVCDGNAADRAVIFAKKNAAGTQLDPGAHNATNYTAGQTRTIAFDNSFIGDEKDNDLFSNSVVTFGGIVEGTDNLNITVSGGLAGDSYSGNMRVLELGITP